MSGRLIRAAAAWLAAGYSIVAMAGCPARRIEDGRFSFSERSLRVADYYLFDAGIVDANDDGFLDIYTSNHIALQSLLLGDGRGNFRNVYSDWGLDHQKEFPGLEDNWTSPVVAEDGIFIYWSKRQLTIRAARRDAVRIASGKVILDSPAEIVTRANWACQVRKELLTPDRTRTEIDFELAAGYHDGLLVLRPELIAVPQTFSFDPSIAVENIFVGAGKEHPRASTFTLALKDRHGMAWADWNGDGRMDLFIAQGGVSGKTGAFPEIYPYELFVGKGTGLADVTRSANLKKCDNRPRQVAWVDIDGDNLLDLFVYGAWSRNQLFRQTPEGRFLDVTVESGLVATENGLSCWFDADGDGDADLFISGRDVYVLYRNERGHFKRTFLGTSPGAGPGAEPEYLQFGHPAVADFDGDGDFDIYVASSRGSALIVNHEGNFTVKDPAEFGLPRRACTASWVDVDNDSLLDLHTLPDGLFRQSAGCRFVKTGILASEEGDSIVAARCNWFDADNDGDRDVLMSLLDRKEEGSRVWSSKFFTNNGSKTHWLEIRVKGPRGNRNAVGAKVVVELGDGRRLTQQVGFSEGSHYSQGHYRLYFGLGKVRDPKSVLVSWPNGAKERTERPGSDRLLVLGPAKE